MNTNVLKRFQSKSYRSGAFYSVLLNGLAKALNIGLLLIIAFYYGTNDKADIYFYCVNTMMLLAAFFRGVNSTVLIPEAMRRREQVSDKDAMAFLNVFLYLVVGVSVLMLGVLLINPPWIIACITGFDAETLLMHKTLLTLSLPLFFLMVVTFYLSDILVSHKCFTLPMILNAINSLIVIIFFFIFHAKLDIVSVIVGMNIGYLAQLIALLYIMRSSLQWNYRVYTTSIPPKVRKDVLASFAGNFVTMFSGYLPLLLFSHLGNGLIASLNYARRLSELPLQLIISQFSAVFGIRMNQLFAQKDWPKINKVFRESAEFLIFLLMPLSTYIFVYSPDIIALLYVHGKFDADSSIATVTLLRYLGILIPFMAINTLVARLFMAGQKVQQAFWYQLFVNGITVLAILSGVHFWGYVGYPIAQACVLFLYVTLACIYILHRHFKMIQYVTIIQYLIISAGINFMIGMLLYHLLALTPLNSFARITIGATVYVATMLGLDQIFVVNHTARKLREELLPMFKTFKNKHKDKDHK